MRDIHFKDPDLMSWQEKFEEYYRFKDMKEFIADTLEDQQAQFIEMLEEEKEKIQTETGSSKYDWCFELMTEKIKDWRDSRITSNKAV
jgi:hypothetical protein